MYNTSNAPLTPLSLYIPSHIPSYIHLLYYDRYGVNGAGDQSADDKKRDEDREMKRRTIQVRRDSGYSGCM